jgi:hypothetical protein
MTTTQQQTVISTALSQVGVHEGRNADGTWNNVNPYAAALGMPNGVSWCCEFTFWVFWKSGVESLLPCKRTAWVPTLAQAFKDAGRYSEYPAIGAVPFFGGDGQIDNLKHVGATVVAFDATTVTIVAGNTNNTGAAQGDGVYKLTYQRKDPYVVGYGYPAYAGGIESADPAWAHQNPSTRAAATAPVLADDYSWARPSITSLKAAGYKATGRYFPLADTPLSEYSSGKFLHAAEAATLLAGGEAIFAFGESGKMRAAAGFAAGVADAKCARAYGDSIGFPKTVPIIFAVDFDATWAQVSEYFRGIWSVLGVLGGVYGSDKITRAARAAGAKYTVQTEAWSLAPDGVSRLHDPDANIIQRVVPQSAHPVQGTDEDIIQHSLPMWTAAVPPEPAYLPDLRAAMDHLVLASRKATPGSTAWSQIRAEYSHVSAIK